MSKAKKDYYIFLNMVKNLYVKFEPQPSDIYIKELEGKLNLLSDKIHDMETIGACESMRMMSKGPAVIDDLWKSHLELSGEFQMLEEIINE